jgi:hypothetical protein
MAMYTLFCSSPDVDAVEFSAWIARLDRLGGVWLHLSIVIVRDSAGRISVAPSSTSTHRLPHLVPVAAELPPASAVIRASRRHRRIHLAIVVGASLDRGSTDCVHLILVDRFAWLP